MSKKTKQIIVIRKDLKMRRGKEIAQGAHASMAAVLSAFTHQTLSEVVEGTIDGYGDAKVYGMRTDDYTDNPLKDWLFGSFRKITVTVQTEQELLDLHRVAKESGLLVGLIQDNGATEFNGVKTYTALAIGPAYDEQIDKLTSSLPLY